MTAIATSTSSARISRFGVGRTTAVQIGAALVGMAVVLFAPQVLNDGDTYWHLAAGEWMAVHGRVLHHDVFSFTAAGQPWMTHEWLSEVLMAFAFRAGGWSGLLVLYAVMAAMAAALLAGALGRVLSGVTLLVTLVLAFSCMAPSLLIRPHVLVMPIIIVWTVELLAAREAGRSPRLFMAPLMVLWANLHGSYVFGFVLLGPFALEALIEGRSNWAKVVRDWGVVGLLCAAATLATPHGLSGLLYPFHILNMRTLNAILEWRPADFSKPGPFELALLATIVVCLLRGVRVPPLRLALLVLLLHMTLQHERHLIVLAVIAPLLLAKPLANALDQRPEPQARAPAAWVAFCLLAAVLVGVRLANPVVRTDGPTSPITALDHVPRALAQRPVLNTYAFGGYLIHRGVKPSIDGRADMYGDAYFKRHLQIMAGDPVSVDQELAARRIDWTVLGPYEPLVRVLDAKPGWRRLYSDQYAIVHVRTEALKAAR